jgi:hypothetical protein
LDRVRLFASLVHRINNPVDLKMFIVDKKQNQCAFADAASVSLGRRPLKKDPWIILSAGDNVAVATAAIAAGEMVAGIETREKIDPGHKVALVDIPLGQPVVKYGQAIGRTTADVKAGEHIHSQNLHFENDRLAATANSAPEEASAEDRARTFMGYAAPTGARRRATISASSPA